MLTALVVFHVIVCLLLIVTVLLQFGKGAETGAIMGSSQAVFSSSQQGNILTKTTTVLVILFAVNTIALTTLKTRERKSSIFDDEAPVATSLSTEEASPAKTPSEDSKAKESTPDDSQPATK